ncbi:hypothetical protein OF83DRAFT_1141974, partial [Amylostereum chailletii]
VTGATGFIGSNVVDRLLKDGYKVRGTARSSKAAQLQKNYASHGNKFEVTIIDDITTSDFTDAVEGVDAIIHVASPFGGATTEQSLKGAIDGTSRILTAGYIAGVKKFVVTASLISILGMQQLREDRVFTEKDYNWVSYESATKPDATPSDVYATAKSLAEKAAWDFAMTHRDVDLTTIHPSTHRSSTAPPVAARLLRDPLCNGTNGFVYTLIDPKAERGRTPPPVGLTTAFVNVLDVARGHVLALKTPPAQERKRIILNGGNFTWAEATKYLHAVRPELADRLPVVDDSADDETKGIMFSRFDTSAAERLLGLRDYIG